MESKLFEIIGKMYARIVGLEEHIANLESSIRSLQIENARLMEETPLTLVDTTTNKPVVGPVVTKKKK
jgi:regulator of replication initiation timing